MNRKIKYTVFVLVIAMLFCSEIFAGGSITIEKVGISVDHWNSSNVSDDYIANGGLRIGDGSWGYFAPVYRFNIPKLGTISSLTLTIYANEHNSGSNEGTSFIVGNETVWHTYTEFTGSSLTTHPHNGIVSNWIQSDGNSYLDYIEIEFDNDGADDIEIYKLSMTIEYANINDTDSIAQYQLLCNLYSMLSTYSSEIGPLLSDIVGGTNDQLLEDGIQKSLSVADALIKLDGVNITDISGNWILGARDIKSSLDNIWSFWKSVENLLSTISDPSGYMYYVGELDEIGEDIVSHLNLCITQTEDVLTSWKSALSNGQMSDVEKTLLGEKISDLREDLNYLKVGDGHPLGYTYGIDDYSDHVLDYRETLSSYCKTHMQLLNPLKVYNENWIRTSYTLEDYIKLMDKLLLILVDNTSPTPNPMTWATLPSATSPTSITMVATTASDSSGVEYYFNETSGNPGGTNSGWQSSTSYTDSGLSQGTTYTYTVKARDKSPQHNLTSPSVSRSSTTPYYPAISNLQPTSGPPGTYMKIQGSHFNSSGSVILGGGATAQILSWSDTQILCKVPNGASSGNVIVQTASSSSGVSYTVTNPTTIYVDGNFISNIENGTTAYPFSTVQRGIDVATTNDEVVVAEGTYYEPVGYIKFNTKSITVRSTEPDNPEVVGATILNGNQINSVVVFDDQENSNTTLTGFTITNGKDDVGNGGGVYIGDSCSPTISNNIITGNSARYGGGVYCYAGCSPTISNNIITGNSAYIGGGICSESTTSTLVTNCTITNNHASISGGIYCGIGSNITITNCTISNNTANRNGGGAFCSNHSDVTIHACKIIGNQADELGGGIYITHDSILIVTNCTIANNQAEYSGGGGILGNSESTITNCILWDNGDDLKGCSTTYSCIEDNDSGTGNIHWDPLFADSAAGDFHLKSEVGRWDSTANGGAGDWVIDSVHSPCINGGNRLTTWSEEPLPNGGRVNMGAYGNTLEAAKSAPAGVPSSIEFSSGPRATRFKIEGSGFGDLQGSTSWGEIAYWSDAEVLLDAPQDAVDGPYSVILTRLGAEDSLPETFTVDSSQEVLYVSPDTNEMWDGTIQYPFPVIQNGIFASDENDTVYVEPGKYYENINLNGKKITLSSLNPHDPNTVNATIIDGSWNGSVVTFDNGENSESVLAGFTITKGSSNNGGGGIYCDGSNPRISDCIIINNFSWGNGGGIQCSNASNPIVENCIISDNDAPDGGGGGIFCEYDSSPTIANCTIENNFADEDGGGIHCTDFSNPTITNCTISSNESALCSGGGIFLWESDTSINNCVINDNTVPSGSGGGIFCYDSNVSINDCEINGNFAGDDGGGIYCENSEPIITNTVIADSYASFGSGICSIGSSPKVLNNEIFDNVATYGGGGLFCYNGQPLINNNWITYNYHSGIYAYDTTIEIKNNIIAGNEGFLSGGVVCDANSLATIENNTIVENWGQDSGGLGLDVGSEAYVSNCIFWNNFTDSDDTQIALFYDEHFAKQTVLDINYSNVEHDHANVYLQDINCQLTWGDYNISNNPEFIANGIWDANDIWCEGDYHLSSGSHCVDAGDPNYLADAGEFDIEGNDRVIGGRIDIGADEYKFGELSDFTGNGIVNLEDFVILSHYWMNIECTESDWCQGCDYDQNGWVDIEDLTHFAADWLWRSAVYQK